MNALKGAVVSQMVEQGEVSLQVSTEITLDATRF